MDKVDVLNLVLCFDGTWNTSDPDEAKNSDVTNVFRIHEMIAKDAVRKNDDGKTVFTQVEYIEGPGTKAGNKISGGLFATDLNEPVKEGYRALFKAARKCAKSHTELRVYLFGFSRGACRRSSTKTRRRFARKQDLRGVTESQSSSWACGTRCLHSTTSTRAFSTACVPHW